MLDKAELGSRELENVDNASEKEQIEASLSSESEFLAEVVEVEVCWCGNYLPIEYNSAKASILLSLSEKRPLKYTIISESELLRILNSQTWCIHFFPSVLNSHASVSLSNFSSEERPLTEQINEDQRPQQEHKILSHLPGLSWVSRVHTSNDECSKEKVVA